MNIQHGKPVSEGIVIGKSFLLESESIRIPAKYITENHIDNEIQKLKTVMKEVVDELHRFADTLAKTTSPKIAEIFVGHAGMLEDDSLREEMHAAIKEKCFTAEFAVASTMRRWRETFSKNDFLQKHVPDLDDLERRLLRHLTGHEGEDISNLQDEIVLVAHSLSPMQIASLDSDKVKGIVSEGDGPTSHAAIIASAFGIPAVVGAENITRRVSGGESIIVDGTNGHVIVEPDRETCLRYSSRSRKLQESERSLLEEMRDLPSKTQDGRRIFSLVANIESPKATAKALDYGAEGIGLYRTELLFLDSERIPSVDEHFHAYMEAINKLDGRPIVMRTLDIGADKLWKLKPDLEARESFLGLRSLRYCLKNPDIFKPQLRAILKAGAYGNVSLMFPMVSGVEEWEEALKVLDDVKSDMDAAGEDYDPDMRVGMMIELPSAAMCADALAERCDFFSIGTNDLIQYTLAVDRAEKDVAGLYRPEHPAVLKLIKLTVDAARKAGIHVGICGAMASSPLFTPLLIGLGLDSLSLAPPQSLPRIKKIIRSIKFSEARQLAARVLEARGPDRARELLMEVNESLPDSS